MDAETAEYFEGLNRVAGVARKAERAARKATSPGLSPDLLEAYFDEGLASRSASSSGQGANRGTVEATAPTTWNQHPLWSSAWLALHPAVREAFEQSFAKFIEVRRLGQLDAFIEGVNDRLAKTIGAAEQEREREGRAAANALQTTHVGYRSPSRDRQADFQQQLAEAKELHRSLAVR